MNMSKEEYTEFENMGIEILITLEEAFNTTNPAGELGKKVAAMH